MDRGNYNTNCSFVHLSMVNMEVGVVVIFGSFFAVVYIFAVVFKKIVNERPRHSLPMKIGLVYVRMSRIFLVDEWDCF